MPFGVGSSFRTSFFTCPLLTSVCFLYLREFNNSGIQKFPLILSSESPGMSYSLLCIYGLDSFLYRGSSICLFDRGFLSPNFVQFPATILFELSLITGRDYYPNFFPDRVSKGSLVLEVPCPPSLAGTLFRSMQATAGAVVAFDSGVLRCLSYTGLLPSHLMP